MAENENSSPIRQSRRTKGNVQNVENISPRKHPYKLGQQKVRSPLKDIQGHHQGGTAWKKGGVVAGVAKKKIGVIGDGKHGVKKGDKSVFIPVDKSCVIVGKNEIRDSPDTGSWNPFSSGVTSGIVGVFQPRGLNSSFSEKFESRLGLNSVEPEGKETDKENKSSPNHKQFIGVQKKRGILTERLDPLFDFPEYHDEILQYWKEMEIKFLVHPKYMDRQKEISHKMRTILIDWIMEVVEEYDLTEETLHLAVNYIDRFLGLLNVERMKLQLVGATALYIASKFEETNPPEVADIAFVTDEAYEKKEILSMEKCMLTALEFDLMTPTSHSFAQSFCISLKLRHQMKQLVMYLVDLSLLEEQFLQYTPSLIAGASVAIARYVFDGKYCDQPFKKTCGYSTVELNPCARQLMKMFFDASTKIQTTLYDKYQSVKYCSVSQMILKNLGPWNE